MPRNNTFDPSISTLNCLTPQQFIHCDSEKLDPFLFEHNFGKYCPILTILSLLQTEINCNQVYPKIYHRTPNLLVHYLVK